MSRPSDGFDERHASVTNDDPGPGLLKNGELMFSATREAGSSAEGLGGLVMR